MNKQKTFFGDPPAEWEEHWRSMPEFVQPKQEPYACINVRFSKQEDLDNFSQLLGQSLNQKTKSIWYPFKSHWGADHNKQVWVDNDPD